MTKTVHPYASEQIVVWLRGLLTIAWADGHYDDEEKELIAKLTQTELAPTLDLGSLEPIEAADLAVLGQNTNVAENFLRTAVMVAIADGIYSPAEAQILEQFCTALGLETTILESLNLTLAKPTEAVETAGSTLAIGAERSSKAVLGTTTQGFEPHLTPLRPVQDWLDQLEIHDPRLARFLCKMIPSQCPFERDINLFGRKVVHIPPLCKLNPLYEQLVGLRFRALSYLADECKEDVSPYI